MADAFGYEYRELPDGVVEVDLGADGKVIVEAYRHGEVLRVAKNAADYREKILGIKQASAEDWAKNRGPDSELGRNMESGTSTTDHSSEPSN